MLLPRGRRNTYIVHNRLFAFFAGQKVGRRSRGGGNDQDQEQRNSRYVNAAADLVGEAFLLSKLEHPNIVRLYGVTAGAVDQAFLHKGGFFLIMEALNSVLSDRLRSYVACDCCPESHDSWQ